MHYQEQPPARLPIRPPSSLADYHREVISFLAAAAATAAAWRRVASEF